MPIPKPNSTETEKEFIERCMSDSVMINEYEDEKQRYAVCSSKYKDVKMSDNSGMIDKITGAIEKLNNKIEDFNNKVDSAVMKLASNNLYETKWIPYIKAGSKIRGKVYTAEWLQKLANNYNPDILSAGLIVDHSNNTRKLSDKPKFGDIAEIKFEDGRLWHRLKNVRPELKEAIDNGHYSGFSWEVRNTHDDDSLPLPYVTASAILGIKNPAITESYITPEMFLENIDEDDNTFIIYYENEMSKETEKLNENIENTDTKKEISVEDTKNTDIEMRLANLEKLETTLKERDSKIAELEKNIADKEAAIELSNYNSRVAEMETAIKSANLPPAVEKALEPIIKMAAHYKKDEVIKLSDGEKEIDVSAMAAIETLANSMKGIKIPAQIQLSDESTNEDDVNNKSMTELAEGSYK